MDLSVEKMVTHTLSINQNYKENTLKVVTMYFFRPFVNDRSDYNAKDISVIDAPERSRQHGKRNK